MHTTTLFALSFSALLLASSASAAVTPISQCGVITQPGDYHVAQDLSGGSPCIWVQSTNDVKIHLDGHTVQGEYTGIAVQNSSNVSIIGNGTVEAVAQAIVILGGSGITIVDVTVNLLRFDAEYGIQLAGTTNATLISNTVTVALPPGLGNSGQGIAVTGGSGNILRANDVSRFGIGLFVVDSTGNLFQANTIKDSTFRDIEENDPCGSNTWNANQFTTSNGQCIQ